VSLNFFGRLHGAPLHFLSFVDEICFSTIKYSPRFFLN